jgi:hypothetical protein
LLCVCKMIPLLLLLYQLPVQNLLLTSRLVLPLTTRLISLALLLFSSLLFFSRLESVDHPAGWSASLGIVSYIMHGKPFLDSTSKVQASNLPTHIFPQVLGFHWIFSIPRSAFSIQHSGFGLQICYSVLIDVAGSTALSRRCWLMELNS